MKLSNLSLLAVLSFTSPLVSAASVDTDPAPRCSYMNFANGAPKEALAAINAFCLPLSGPMPGNAGKMGCFDLKSVSYEVSVFNMEDTERYLDFGPCIGFLYKLTLCPKGGVKTTSPTNWHFRLTPKKEKCKAILR